MESNAILDQAEQRVDEVKTQAQTTQAQISEAVRQEIGPRHYRQAKEKLGEIEHSIRTEYRPFCAQLASIATKAKTPLPTRVHNWVGEMTEFCDNIPRQVRAGIEGYERVTVPPWKDGSPDKVVRTKLVRDIRLLLNSWDGTLCYLKERKAWIEDYIQQSGWPAKQPTAATMAPAPPLHERPAPVRVEAEFSV